MPVQHAGAIITSISVTIYSPHELSAFIQEGSSSVESEGTQRPFGPAFVPFFGERPSIYAHQTTVKGVRTVVPELALEAKVGGYRPSLSYFIYPSYVRFAARLRATEGVQTIAAEYSLSNLPASLNEVILIIRRLLSKYYRADGVRPSVKQAFFTPPAHIYDTLQSIFQHYPSPSRIPCVSVRADTGLLTQNSPVDRLLLIPIIMTMCEGQTEPTLNPGISGIVLGIRSQD